MPLTSRRNLPGNLVAQWLRRNDGHLLDDAFVRVEVHGQPGVVLLDDDLRGLLDGFGTNATLKMQNMINKLRSRISRFWAQISGAFCG